MRLTTPIPHGTRTKNKVWNCVLLINHSLYHTLYDTLYDLCGALGVDVDPRLVDRVYNRTNGI